MVRYVHMQRRTNIFIYTFLALLVVLGFAIVLVTRQPTRESQDAGAVRSGETLDKYAEVTVPAVEDTTPAVTVPSSWQEYTNTAYGYAIQYPKDWKVWASNLEEFGGTGFSPQDWVHDFKWGIGVFDSARKTKDELIAEVGDQFKSNRRERREDIVIDGIPATRVIVTTESHPSWYYDGIYIEHEGRIYGISNGAVKDDRYESFYISFRFSD